MKCPYCGTENRHDVRFCKECGRSLDAAPTGASEARTSPMAGSSSGRSCPHCGSAVKPEARFCPRCGEALSTDQPAASPAQQPSYSEASPPPSQPQSQGPSPAPAPSQPPYAEPQQQPPQASSTQPNNLQSGAPPAAYNEPQAASPPSGGLGGSGAVSIGEQSTLPPWLWIVIGVAIGIVVLIVIFFGFRMLTNGDEAAPTPTLTPTATATPTPTGTTETVDPSPTEPPDPTWTPTLQPETPTPTLEPYGAKLTPDLTEAEVKAGEPLSLTFTLSNTGEVSMNMVEYHLLGNWEHYFTLPQSPQPTSDSIQPQGNHSLTFTFQPTQPPQEGPAEITLLVILSVNDNPPSTESTVSGPVQVTIAP